MARRLSGARPAPTRARLWASGRRHRGLFLRGARQGGATFEGSPRRTRCLGTTRRRLAEHVPTSGCWGQHTPSCQPRPHPQTSMAAAGEAAARLPLVYPVQLPACLPARASTGLCARARMPLTHGRDATWQAWRCMRAVREKSLVVFLQGARARKHSRDSVLAGSKKQLRRLTKMRSNAQALVTPWHESATGGRFVRFARRETAGRI